MTDDLDPTRLLASAALDNEVTADERAQVAASPSLFAEMETYAALRDELAAVEVPAASRGSAIAAALAVFDAIQAGTDQSSTADAAAVAVTPPTPGGAESTRASNVVSLHARRQRQYRWLGGAAAAAIVAVLAVAAINGSNGEDEKSSSATPSPRVETIDSAAKATGEATSSPELEAATQGAPVPAAATTAATVVPFGGSGGGQSSPTVAAAAETTAADDSAADTAGIDPWAAAPAFNNVTEVSAFALAPGSPLAPPFIASADTAAATETTAAASAGSATTTSMPLPPTPVSAAAPTAFDLCATGRPFVPILFIGEQDLLVRDDAIGQFEIIEPSTCAIRATFPVS